MENKKIIKKEIDLAGKKLSLETGKLATLANMAVKATYGETTVLITTVSGEYNADINYFPLNINYLEKFYASGTIKSSRFQKRDGRRSDEAIIAGRAIDHAVRPLFPSDFYNEVQVIATVLSLDEACDPELLSMIGVSAALHASNIPWNGPITPSRVGYVDGEYVLAPGRDVLHGKSDLDIVLSFVGDDKRFLSLEGEANALPEEKILGAVEYARNNVDDLQKFILDFAKEVNPKGEKMEYEPRKIDEDLMKDVSKIAEKKIYEAMKEGFDKDDMSEKLSDILEEVYTGLEGKYKKVDMSVAVEAIKKNTLGSMILETEKRPDGRGIKEVRSISCEVGVLPRVHGSALFSRGITQVMTIATLASPAQELILQDMYGERTKKYIHYYTFPPYSSGETGRVGFPKNREIGHGMIAENALRPVVPSQEDFPYMILLTSETMSSSGSTSMAATCGSSLALMDAGVPISDAIAGIGVGLMADKDFKKSLIMTDLSYMEDAFGLLDFKMTGTREGVTAIQCDMKSDGIPFELLPKIIEQSKEGRMHVLDQMEKIITESRGEVSEYAPKTASVKIDPDKIGMVIGSGGKVIKDIQEKTGADIAIDDDGTVVASSTDRESVQKAIEIVSNIVREVKAGEVFDGVVEEVVDFGAFVEILPGKTGLLHVSEISNEYVTDVYAAIKAGDNVKVKVLEVSRDGKMSLSIKALLPRTETRNDDRDSGNDRGGRDNYRGKRRNNR
ncbi:polyribonucleotide nucleotidyltransferase [Patescibacteria group bacterium]